MRIAVVEDEKREAKILTDRLARYAEEHDIAAEIEWFPDAVIFLARFRPVYDIVFMDIDMPDLSGMDAAKKLREIDHIVPLVFVTALPSFAVQGYSVDASDYIVKPYSYAALESALGRINVKRGRDIILANTGGTRRLPLDSVYYIEVSKHRVMYHTDIGVIDVWGTMKDTEKSLPDGVFVRCGVSFLVNPKYITAVEGDEVTAGGDVIKISRAYKKKFIAALNMYIAQGRGKSG